MGDFIKNEHLTLLEKVSDLTRVLPFNKNPLLSMGFSRQEYWSGHTFPSPGDLPNAGIKLGSSALQAACLPYEPPGSSGSQL